MQDGTNDIPTLETINKSIEGAINELKGSLDKVENGSLRIEQLETVNKTLLGAINELKQGHDDLDIRVTKNTDDIAEVSSQMAEKVNKVAGKDLSTNDYTDSEKQKNEDNKNNIFDLAGIGRTTETVKKNSNDIASNKKELEKLSKLGFDYKIKDLRTVEGDANLMDNTGFYFVRETTTTNLPTRTGEGYLEIFRALSNNMMQRFTRWSSGRVFTRQLVNNEWKDWHELARVSDLCDRSDLENYILSVNCVLG